MSQQKIKREPKIAAVDFDGTLCRDIYPEIGEPNQLLIDFIKWRQKEGDKFILWTCRTGDRLKEALAWSHKHGIRWDAVNKNLPEMIEEHGGDTRKVFADIYIDDRGFQWDFDTSEEGWVN